MSTPVSSELSQKAEEAKTLFRGPSWPTTTTDLIPNARS